jgi:hypothetical protein
MEFYDATFHAQSDFLLFLDADTFLVDGNWASSYFAAFDNPKVAAVSFVPRRGAAAIFDLLCRAESFRALPPPALACCMSFLRIGHMEPICNRESFLARELIKSGKIIVNIAGDESSRNAANFRGTTGF